jgi:uncharacterized membrane protein HdeD (DUF308 family)
MATMTDSARAEAMLAGTRALERRWGWLLLLGIVQVICGAVALAIPVAASLAAAIVAGALLLASGIFQLFHAFSIRPWRGAALPIVGGALYVIVGVLLLAFPVTGALTLTIAVGALLIADGVVHIVLSRAIRAMPGSGWMLAAGIASVLVGILLLIGWPLTGLIALGVLLGISLLFSGATNAALAVAFRARRHREGENGSLEHARRHA